MLHSTSLTIEYTTSNKTVFEREKITPRKHSLKFFPKATRTLHHFMSYICSSFFFFSFPLFSSPSLFAFLPLVHPEIISAIRSRETHSKIITCEKTSTRFWTKETASLQNPYSSSTSKAPKKTRQDKGRRYHKILSQIL